MCLRLLQQQSNFLQAYLLVRCFMPFKGREDGLRHLPALWVFEEFLGCRHALARGQSGGETQIGKRERVLTFL